MDADGQGEGREEGEGAHGGAGGACCTYEPGRRRVRALVRARTDEKEGPSPRTRCRSGLALALAASTLAAPALAQPVHPDLGGDALVDALVADFKPAVVLTLEQSKDTLYAVVDTAHVAGRVGSVGVYTGLFVPFDCDPTCDPSQDVNNGGAGLNQEHVWPRSRGAACPPGSVPTCDGRAESDLHHLRAARGAVNSARGNLPLRRQPRRPDLGVVPARRRHLDGARQRAGRVERAPERPPVRAAPVREGRRGPGRVLRVHHVWPARDAPGRPGVLRRDAGDAARLERPRPAGRARDGADVAGGPIPGKQAEPVRPGPDPGAAGLQRRLGPVGAGLVLRPGRLGQRAPLRRRGRRRRRVRRGRRRRRVPHRRRTGGDAVQRVRRRALPGPPAWRP